MVEKLWEQACVLGEGQRIAHILGCSLEDFEVPSEKQFFLSSEHGAAWSLCGKSSHSLLPKSPI